MAMGCEITHMFHFSGANIAIRLKFHNKVVQVLCRTSHCKYIRNRKNMAYLVKNVNGTSGMLPRNGDSWLEYWERETGKRAYFCHRQGCMEFGHDNLVGAHVKLVGSTDNSWYIVPLCQGCNHTDDNFWVEGPLVPVR